MEKSQNTDRKFFVLPVLALEPMLAERAGETSVGEMQCFFGDVFERTSADVDFVVSRHSTERNC